MHSVEAHAKINLSLAVKGKRPDGFHEMESLMIPVGLSDTLTFREASEFSFSSNRSDIPTDESNLVVKVARLFERKTGVNLRLHIHLEKRIPHGAGLGGGSSDAAAALSVLNKLYGQGLSLAELSEMAAELGSDIPFFLHDGMCLCRGRGEIIEPLPGEWEKPVLLVKPPFGVSTPAAYNAWKNSREMEGVFYGKQEFVGKILFNDLERPVFEKHIFLSVLKMWLLRQEGVSVALMSGSGSTLYALCHSVKKCEELTVRLKFLDKSLWTWFGVTH